jgi:hypothetical protein
MEILWINHPTQPELNGTTEHVSRAFAETARGYRQAEYVKEPARGSKDWLAWRNRAAATVTAPSEYDTPAGNQECWSRDFLLLDPASRLSSRREATVDGSREHWRPGTGKVPTREKAAGATCP